MWSRRKLIAAAAIVLVVTTATTLVVTHRDAVTTARAAAEAPPRHASPEQYTRVFLRAAKAHDCALMSYLSVSESETWCPKAPTAWADGRPELLAYRNVGKAFAVSAEEAGRASVITQRWMNGADPGTMEWGWCWVRTHDGWRLYDQGQG